MIRRPRPSYRELLTPGHRHDDRLTFWDAVLYGALTLATLALGFVVVILLIVMYA